MLIGLVCSVKKEASRIVTEIKDQTPSRYFNLDFLSGVLKDRKVVLVFSGVGKVNAAYATSVLLCRFDPDIIINFGIAGAFPGLNLPIGGIALSEEECYADEGILLDRGFSDMRFIGIPLIKSNGKDLYNMIPVSKGLLNQAKSGLQRYNIDYWSGRFITVSTVTGTKHRAEYLWRRYRPVCESMEGAAVAHVARASNKDFLEIRGISNLVGRRDRRQWDCETAASRCEEALLRVLEHL